MSKGITPVISIILLLLITIAMMGFAALFFQRTTETSGEAGEQQLSQQTAALGENFEIININENNVTIRNKGTSALSNLAFFVDSNPVQASGTPIPRDGVGTFTIDAGQLAEYPGRELKVTSPGYSAKLDANFYGKNTVAYYTFDSTDGRTIKDDSGNGNDGTFSGEAWNDGTVNGATDATGKYGSALSFDGISNYVSIADSSSLNITDNLTIALWVYPKNLTNRQGYVVKRQVGTNMSYEFLQYDDRLRFTMRNNSIYYEAWSNPALVQDQWQHVAVVITSGSTAKMYRNGILLGMGSSATFPSLPSTTGTVWIGYNEEEGRYFNGTIDEVRVYNRALTQGEIIDDMNSAYPINRTVASYSFENGAKDTHNVVKGKYGAALSFDGVDDYVDAGNASSLNPTSAITLEAWINVAGRNSHPGNEYILAKGMNNAPGGGYNIQFGHVNNQTMLTIFTNETGTMTAASATNSISLNNWYHVAGAYNGAALISYINGVEAGRVSGTGAINTSANTLRIGLRSDYLNVPFNGTIDEVRILNTTIV